MHHAFLEILASLRHLAPAWAIPLAWDPLKISGDSSAKTLVLKNAEMLEEDVEKFHNQVIGPESNALITGATSGIGKEIATAIALTGAAVCIAGQSSQRLSALAERLSTTARSVLVYESDLTNDSAIKILVRRLRRKFENLDILVHCAGAFTTGKIEITSLGQLDFLYRANVRLPFALTQALLPLLKLRRGQIVFINSSQGLEARANAGAFALTQHALRALANSLRQEVNSNERGEHRWRANLR